MERLRLHQSLQEAVKGGGATPRQCVQKQTTSLRPRGRRPDVVHEFGGNGFDLVEDVKNRVGVHVLEDGIAVLDESLAI